jgi:hypothetical protein
MILIGLGNKARQGKDFVANYMQEAIPDIVFYSFADELKRHCRKHHDELLPQWQLARQTKQMPACKEDPIYGYGPILQWYGTEVVRKQSPDHWVHVIASKIEIEKPEIAVIKDVRFPNEATWVKNHDGFLVEVIRLNEDGTRYYDPNRDKNHTSETALDDYMGWDFIIRAQSGDLKSLRLKSLGVLKAIVNQRRAALASLPDSTGCSGD